MAKQRLEILFIGQEQNLANRVQQSATEFQYRFGVTENTDTYTELEELAQTAYLVIVSAVQEEQESNIAGMVQIVRQFSPESFIVVVVNKKVSAESGQFIKKSGASLVITEHDFINTSKVDFIATQKVKGNYIPVKVSEFRIDTAPEFNLYHLLPMNQKYLPVTFANADITPAKYEKMKSVGELYVKRDDLKLYNEYLKTFQDLSAAGLTSRVRAQFLLLSNSYVDLALMLSDQSESASFSFGKGLYEKVVTYASDLLMNLGAIGEAVDVINNSSVGDFGYVDRAPAVAAYAGLLSLASGIGTPEEVMVAALIADIGLMELSPKVMSKIRKDRMDDLTKDELSEYHKHPIVSVNTVLSRRLPMETNVKDIVIETHERADRNGFPNRPLHADKISHEAQLIHFCEIVDQLSMLKMGRARKSPIIIRKEIYENELKQSKVFSLPFIQRLKGNL